MSRSYRKPWVVDGYGSKGKVFSKNYANRRIRRKKDAIPNGMHYRKMTCPWEICDFKYPIDLKDPFYAEEPWKYNRK